jgi:hypothetical protein
MGLIAVTLGVVVGITHAVLVLRQGVTLRPVLLILLGLVAAGFIWAIAVSLSGPQERLWWGFVTAFAVSTGLVNLAAQAGRRRSAH